MTKTTRRQFVQSAAALGALSGLERVASVAHLARDHRLEALRQLFAPSTWPELDSDRAIFAMKLAELGISEQDVSDAVSWARGER